MFGFGKGKSDIFPNLSENISRSEAEEIDKYYGKVAEQYPMLADPEVFTDIIYLGDDMGCFGMVDFLSHPNDRGEFVELILCFTEPGFVGTARLNDANACPIEEVEGTMYEAAATACEFAQRL